MSASSSFREADQRTCTCGHGHFDHLGTTGGFCLFPMCDCREFAPAVSTEAKAILNYLPSFVDALTKKENQ